MQNTKETLLQMKIKSDLLNLQDEGYKTFHSALMPTVPAEKIIGVRTPALRKYAKTFAKMKEMPEFLKDLPHRYYEEDNLHAFILCEMKDLESCLKELERFLPYIDNWATCDMLRPKVFKKKPASLIPYINKWLESDNPYVVRYAIGMLLSYFLDDEFRMEYPEYVATIESEEYYVRMMQAWYFATALAKQWEAVIPFIEERRMNKWVHNKTIQKAIESYRITAQQKEYLRSLRRLKN